MQPGMRVKVVFSAREVISCGDWLTSRFLYSELFLMPIPKLYNAHFVQKSDERSELFQSIAEAFKTRRGLYPGSFAHITPSFFVPEMVYVDSDQRCPKFFSDDVTLQYIAERKRYPQPASVQFYAADYAKGIPEALDSFDVLFSFYAGFISEYCTQYLRAGGILVANNSHGDAPLAYLNPNYKLISVINRRAERFSFSSDMLDSYFLTKSGKPLVKEEILETMRGPAYTKAPYAYIFQKE